MIGKHICSLINNKLSASNQSGNTYSCRIYPHHLLVIISYLSKQTLCSLHVWHSKIYGHKILLHLSVSSHTNLGLGVGERGVGGWSGMSSGPYLYVFLIKKISWRWKFLTFYVQSICIIVAANAPNHCLINIASSCLFLAACFSFSSATNPTCLTLSLDKPILLLISSQVRHSLSRP